MSYTDPNGWQRPKTDSGEPPSVPTHGNDGMGTGVPWAPADGIATTDLDRIETNIKGLHTLLCQSGSVDVQVNPLYFSGQVDATLLWIRINNIVFLAFPEMESPATTNNLELQINPATVWPSEILPDSPVPASALFTKDQDDLESGRPGYMLIPSVAANPIICRITSSAVDDKEGCFCDGTEVGYTGFSSAESPHGGNKKAIIAQTVMWMTNRPAGSYEVTTTSTTTAAP